MWYELRSPFVEGLPGERGPVEGVSGEGMPGERGSLERAAVSEQERGLGLGFEGLRPGYEEYSYPYQVSMEGKEIFSNEVLGNEGGAGI